MTGNVPRRLIVYARALLLLVVAATSCGRNEPQAATRGSAQNPPAWVSSPEIAAATALAEAPIKTKFSSAPGSPAAALFACAKALNRGDYKAAASMVVDGDTTYDYRRMLGYVTDLNRGPIGIRVSSEQKSGDNAILRFSATYGDPPGNEEQVTLKRSGQIWKLIAWIDETNGFTSILKNFVNPRAQMWFVDQANALSRNKAPWSVRLGRARSNLLDQVFRASAREDQNPNRRIPYSGYSQSTFDQFTTVIFPAGRADELLFCLRFPGDMKGGYLTHWKLVRGKPRRLWQVNITGKGVAVPKEGTLAQYLDTPYIPKNAPDEFKRLEGVIQGYASYSLSAPISTYYCSFFAGMSGEAAAKVSPKSRGDDGPPVGSDAVFIGAMPEAVSHEQGVIQTSKEGFFITPEEIAYLSRKKSP